MSSNYPQPRNRDDFTVAILCAKRVETNAVEAMFDQHWEESRYGKAQGDTNSYHVGEIRGHMVVLAYLSDLGTKSAASSASDLNHSFRYLRLVLVVGICGGVPEIDDCNGVSEVLLGDVIISTRLVEYRSGKQLPNRFEEKETLRLTPAEIRKHLGKLEGDYHSNRLQADTATYLSAALQKLRDQKWKYPGPSRDRLYERSHRHKHHDPGICEKCDQCEKDEHEVCEAALGSPCEKLGCHRTVRRSRLTESDEDSGSTSPLMEEEKALARDPELLIFFGVVASGDVVMKSWFHRNEVVSKQRLGNQKIIAFEMEGAGVWETFPTVVIKGVSDYADSHKRDEWQAHAAARAAACAKAFLTQWTKTDTEKLPSWTSPSGTISKRSTTEMASARDRTGDGLIHEDGLNQAQPLVSRGSDDDRMVRDKVDHAEALLVIRDKNDMQKHLDEALGLLMQARESPSIRDSRLLYRVFWGLMIAEKELSCKTSFSVEEKLLHIKNADLWGSELSGKSMGPGPRIHVELERCIIRGREAVLELRQAPDSKAWRETKDDAVKDIDRILEELKREDPPRYEKNEKLARIWKTRLVGQRSSQI